MILRLLTDAAIHIKFY